jgi:hypothetical protein
MHIPTDEEMGVDKCLHIINSAVTWQVSPWLGQRTPTRKLKQLSLMGWRFVRTKGHGWARLLCPLGTREGCQISVWSTPRNPEGHAKGIRRNIDRCGHGEDDEDV